MKKHRNKIIAVAFVLCVLAGAWVLGGNYAVRDDASSRTPSSSALAASAAAQGTEAGADAKDSEAREASGSGALQPLGEGREDATETSAEISVEDPAVGADVGVGGAEAPKVTDAASSPSGAATDAEASKAEASSGMVIDPETGKDKYLTDPVPAGKPVPVEPQDAVVGDRALTCTLSVRCDTILDNMKMLDKEKHELVPADGVIFPPTAVTFYEGESVFNVLQREMKRAGIHMEFENTPIYNSAYIEGINNLYEFDVGELSGWMYKVNGWYPNYGCSRYQVKEGDLIEWNYTCDLGRDLGEFWVRGDYDH